MEKLACIFPGQGVQYPGMGKSIYEKYEIVRNTYEEASEAAGLDVAKLCFDGPLMKQNDITVMQIINVITSVAFYRAFFEEYHVRPQFFAGHSMGEYAAYVCCGALGLKDAVKILLERGRLLQKAIDQQRGYMAIVEGVRADEIQKCIVENIYKNVSIACYNDLLQNAVSGTVDEMDQLCSVLRTDGAAVTPLLNSPPIHSSVLGQDIVDEFENYINKIEFFPYTTPVISNVNGEPNCDYAKLAKLLSRQLYCPVQWMETINQFARYGITTIVEMGPKLLLNKFTNKDEIKTYCMGIINDEKLFSELYKFDESLKRDRISFIGSCLVMAVSMKNLNEDNREYKEIVVSSYNKMKEYSDKKLSLRDYENAAELLLRLLLGKKISKPGIIHCFEKLMNETGTNYKLQNWYKSRMESI